MTQPATLSRFRAHPGSVYSVDPRPVWAKILYWTDHPPEAVESDNYFLPLRNHFNRGRVRPGENPYQAGDEIDVFVRLPDGQFAKATFETQFVDDSMVKVVKVMEWRYGGGHVDLDLKAEYAGDSRWRLLHRATGKLFRTGVSMAEAERLAGQKLTPDSGGKSVDEMNGAELQDAYRQKAGKGFPPGTDLNQRREMVRQVMGGEAA